MRALVPVNLRPPGPLTELGNRFGLVFLSLPIGIDDPVRRVLDVRARMAALKNPNSRWSRSGSWRRWAWRPNSSRNASSTSWPPTPASSSPTCAGPKRPRYLAGRRITRQLFWVPQSGGIGIGISVLSYAGQVSFGVVTDAGRVPDPSGIAARFAEQFESLLLRALMLPWPGEAGALAALAARRSPPQ